LMRGRLVWMGLRKTIPRMSLVRPVVIPRSSIQQSYVKLFRENADNHQIKIDDDIEKEDIRNIGIIAHVDAGKTTTTERMLYYSGYQNVVGNVDDGDTMTDYMPQEIERGITITSAAITFPWKNKRINLIDTPGHVDFTFEVERSVRVLDGAVIILDGCAGVEAQTKRVALQAKRYGIPMVVFINKMDKDGACAQQTIEDIQMKLKLNPIKVQHPVGSGNMFSGVIDLIESELITFDQEDQGKQVIRVPIDASHELYDVLTTEREIMIDAIASLDETFGDMYLEEVPFTSQDIHEAIQRIVLNHQGVPVFVGTALRNMGVQPVMDAMVRYLPNPKLVRPPLTDDGSALTYKLDSDPFVGFAFKVIHDDNMGPLTFVRVYSGTLKSRSQLFNASTGEMDRVLNIYQMHANLPQAISKVGAGNIAVLVGLKTVKTGDTLVSKLSKHNPPILSSIQIPSPVFIQPIEVETSTDESKLVAALNQLVREDPSLQVTKDEDTEQHLLHGMGELHLDIITDRLSKEFGLSFHRDKLFVAYREGLVSPLKHQSINFERSTNNKNYAADVSLSLLPISVDDTAQTDDCNHLTQHLIEYDPKVILRGSMRTKFEEGVNAGLMRGPLRGFPLHGVRVRVHSVSFPDDMPNDLASMSVFLAAHTLISKSLSKHSSNMILLEPFMDVHVTSEPHYIKSITHDMNTRGGQVLDFSSSGISQDSSIHALLPLRSMVGYSTDLRILTQGNCEFSMQLFRYDEVSSTDIDDS